MRSIRIFLAGLGNWQKVIKNKGHGKSANSSRKPQISNSSYFQKFSAVSLGLFILLVSCQQPPAPPIAPTATAVPTLNPSANPTATPTLAVTNPDQVHLPMISSPATAVSTPTRQPTAVPATATPPYPLYDGPPIPKDMIGVQIHLHQEDQRWLLRHLQGLGVGWVKVQVAWKVYEPQPGQLAPDRFDELDRLVEGAANNGMQVLLSVSKAPEWSRPTTEMDGPPTDPALFEDFMQALAARYQGQVSAYELWNEPNLQREWNGAPLNAAAFVALATAGAAGVRTADPSAIIISGAPATTGINDGVTAIDDRVYLQQMLAAGLGQVVDVIGVHPYGWANPPDSSADNPDPATTSHNNHPSFFFKDTLNDYANLLTGSGLPATSLWVTEFGWGSFENFDTAPPPGAEFMTAVSEWQQAVYMQRAFEIGHASPQIGPMILWNLNFAETLGPEFSESGYSLLRPDGSRRPAYRALENLPKN